MKTKVMTMAMLAAMLMTASIGQAAIVWSGPDQDVTLSGWNDAKIDIAGSPGAWDDLSVHIEIDIQSMPMRAMGKCEIRADWVDNFVASAIRDDGTYLVNLDEGDVIDGTWSYRKDDFNYFFQYMYMGDAGYFSMDGAFYNQSGYIALKLTDELAKTHYGWASVTTSDLPVDTGDIYSSFGNPTLVVHEWAYNDIPGQAILAGQIVPEPATMAILGLGGLGLLRRNKQ